MYEQLIRDELKASANLVDQFINHNTNIENISQAANLIVQAFRRGAKVISCGNGGSHCDAMHFAQELTGKYRENRPSLPAIAVSDMSHLSCVANDYGYEFVFSRFVEGMGQAGDILLAISTSGNSKNIIEAIKVAKDKNMQTIALTGNQGGKIAKIIDLEIRVPHRGYADRIQEFHIKIIHILIHLIELQMFK